MINCTLCRIFDRLTKWIVVVIAEQSLHEIISGEVRRRVTGKHMMEQVGPRGHHNIHIAVSLLNIQYIIYREYSRVYRE